MENISGKPIRKEGQYPFFPKTLELYFDGEKTFKQERKIIQEFDEETNQQKIILSF